MCSCYFDYKINIFCPHFIPLYSGRPSPLKPVLLHRISKHRGHLVLGWVSPHHSEHLTPEGIYTLMLQTITLSRQGQENLKNDLLSELNTTGMNPLRRYAVLNTLWKAAKDSADQVSDSGIQFALSDERTRVLANSGKQFQLDGLTFQVQFNPKYNFEAHDDDGSYKACLKTIAEYDAKKKALTQQRKALEAQILAAHPMLKPNADSTTTLKFIAGDENK